MNAHFTAKTIFSKLEIFSRIPRASFDTRRTSIETYASNGGRVTTGRIPMRTEAWQRLGLH